MNARTKLLFMWFANLLKVVRGQGFLPSQLSHLTDQKYDENKFAQTLKALNDNMDSFSAGIEEEDYHNFEKSSLMCFHLNIEGREETAEEDESGMSYLGWWLPLKHNFVAWRAMNVQHPLSKFMSTVGLATIDVKGQNLEVVFQGSQFFRADVQGIDFTNRRLYVSPPNNLEDNRPHIPVPDAKDKALAKKLHDLINKLPSSKCLPWADPKKLCPVSQLFTTIQPNGEVVRAGFDTFKEACTNTHQSPTKFFQCRNAFANFYPCFSKYLRSSKKCSVGIDSVIDVGVIIHLMSEAPWEYLLMIASDEPWDEEFEKALNLLGLMNSNNSN